MRTLKRLAETMIKTLNPSRDIQGQAQPVQVREGERSKGEAMIIDIDITEKQTDALSQVLKRIGYTDIRALSQDDAEAYDAQYSLEQIRQSLIKQGYNPR